ncbi:hypothetical protein STSP2_00985 [Anaerohalosphaera lusitana]|uniref:Probable pectate lyase C n=1 Tax=Anaerohalosphaera lusitana TaxID=1936003 RepID=A0A1U9NJC5_9BACT|nr:right-handed parallel beta-helix repeat-containing protein [Anaerohalosphaera lusitana]AQT67834.1 hypothetical protein STSP2_00985 [Anaerohalosphaera lusitana]
MKKSILLLALFVCLPSAHAANLTVGTGQTYPDIKSAVTAASPGDTITVTDGTYTGTNNTMLDFQGKDLILQSANGPAACTIDCQSAANSSAFVFFMTGESSAAAVDGFTIINATNNAIQINGGWDGSTSPTIKNCVFKNNSAYLGAAISCIDTASLITDCTFTNNSAALGAAISVGGFVNPTIENCVITDNTASESGGAIYCDPHLSPTINNCLLANNSAAQKGGAIFCDYGANAIITNCTIAHNSAGFNGGGGIYCYSTYSAATTPTVTNCTIAYNTNYGIYEDGQNADPTVTFCHFYSNTVADFRDYDTWQFSTAAEINMNISNASDNIDGDPLFVTGPLSDYYLSQTASGQPSQSPCVDAGSDLAYNLSLDALTTRTDGVHDTATVDIGYHHPEAPASLYSLTASVTGSNGSISPESGSYAPGTTVDLTASPAPGYRVSQWSGTDDDTLKTNTNQVTMDADRSVTVEFEAVPTTLYVDDDGPGQPSEDGTQTYPFDTIQEALDLIPTDGTVIVMDGTYTGTGNNLINFNGKALTLKSLNGPANCTIDCQSGALAFRFENNETNTSLIDGFTITRGYAFEGAAINLSYASPTITNCIITDSHAYGSNTGGGAIRCLASSPVIDNCTFKNNSAYHFGGAIQAALNSSPTITDCAFIANSADNAGGAIYASLSDPQIKNCRFTANDTANVGGAIYASESPFGMTNCTVNYNTTANTVGGIACYDCSPSITNSIFTHNVGTAIYENHSASDPAVTYCLFYDNPDGDYYDNDTSATCTGATDINALPHASNNIDGDPLYASDTGRWILDGDDIYWSDGDYRLQSRNGRYDPTTKSWIKDSVTSPAIDAGDPLADWTLELYPHGQLINLGAYGGTRQASMSDSTSGSAADLQNDGTVDANDLSLLGESWLNNDAALSPADISRNGQIDFSDFASFSRDW